MAYWTKLEDRALITVGGGDAAEFLQGLITADIEAVDRDGAGYGALLTPQGKILFDFLVTPRDGGYLLDTPDATAPDLLKRLTFYKLRADVDLADVSADFDVVAYWGDSMDMSCGFADPRLAALGRRDNTAKGSADPAQNAATNADWQAHRIGLGVPEALHDFDYGEMFPHDVDLDDLNGVDFGKGCFVGQEVVSRMHHRGSARRRALIVEGNADLPARGTEILAGERVIGEMGSHAGRTGLAIVRIDKVAGAIRDGQEITCGGVRLDARLPSFATFTWPEDAAATAQ